MIDGAIVQFEDAHAHEKIPLSIPFLLEPFQVVPIAQAQDDVFSSGSPRSPSE
jgi:hypothetical protein